MRVAIVGYGGIANFHVEQLRRFPEVQITVVFGLKPDRAAAFAAAQGIPRSTTDYAETVSLADAVVICSPSHFHTEQARQTLQAGRHTLVELPACENAAEAAQLKAEAEKNGVALRCAHTSRFLSPPQRVREYVQRGVLGEIQQVNASRYIPPRQRNWVDDALLHHSGHIMDLCLEWFGDLAPLACAGLPQIQNAQSVSWMGKLPNGAPVAASVSYKGHLRSYTITVVGEHHTVETDVLSYVRSDLTELEFRGEEQKLFQKAVYEQDAAFLQACSGEAAPVSWSTTIRLAQVVDQFRQLASSQT